MYAQTPSPVGYPGSLVPATQYYSGPQSYPNNQQLREVDEMSHRGMYNLLTGL